MPWDQVPDLGRVLQADRDRMAEIYDNLAKAEIGLSEPDVAARVADARERAARWTPKHYERARLAGAAWLVADDPARALVRLEAALRYAPPSEVVAAKAMLTEAQEGTHRRAQAAFDAGMAANHQVGAQKEALRAFEEAVRLDPGYAAAHVERARILRYNGNITGALDALREATAALDSAKTPADSADRTIVKSLVAQYERDIQNDPDAEKESGPKVPK